MGFATKHKSRFLIRNWLKVLIVGVLLFFSITLIAYKFRNPQVVFIHEWDFVKVENGILFLSANALIYNPNFYPVFFEGIGFNYMHENRTIASFFISEKTHLSSRIETTVKVNAELDIGVLAELLSPLISGQSVVFEECVWVEMPFFSFKVKRKRSRSSLDFESSIQQLKKHIQFHFELLSANHSNPLVYTSKMNVVVQSLFPLPIEMKSIEGEIHLTNDTQIHLANFHHSESIVFSALNTAQFMVDLQHTKEFDSLTYFEQNHLLMTSIIGTIEGNVDLEFEGNRFQFPLRTVVTMIMQPNFYRKESMSELGSIY